MSLDRAALPQPAGISGDDLIDAAGALLGRLEDLVGGPLYPIDYYLAEVDERLVRCAWPGSRELQDLKAQGVEVVVNLCAERRQDEQVLAAGMIPGNIPLEDNRVPRPGAVEAFLDLFSDFQLIAVHCEAGKGRTGCVVAAYRVHRCGWAPADALEEAERYGLAMPCQKAWILALRSAR